MIEVNLFSVPASDYTTTVGKCVSRSRVDLDSIKVSVLEFVKGFLKDNLDNLESGLSSSDLVELINSDRALTMVDLSSIKYYLSQIGYRLEVWNVAEDEDNPRGVGSGTLEYNVINRTYPQNGFPTVTKLIPGDNENVASVASTIVEQSGLFDTDKFKGIKNPFNILVNNLKDEEGKVGIINSSIITKIYTLLDLMGFSVFCATSED